MSEYNPPSDKTTSLAMAAYLRGVKNGIRQERERVRGRLAEIREDERQLRWMAPLIDEIEQHIGLGAVEESEK